ncbi:UNVERIFIED_CONTAM: Mitochondrial import inner membrane translocase subunit TIM17-2 [Sesamum radiatum]|uniref:Mitochondrial import inner membrane translocase subunit TIM17-2 n=1 Tax=Sesamum radiatum TaxID=300843 RepID=A0AAW2MJV3_SESRA
MGTPETSREPCPDRILDDVGGAFGMGAVGGAAFHFLKGIYNSPKGERLVGGSQAVRMNAPRVGGSFAVWGLGAASRSALFGGVLLALIEGAGIMLNKVMSAPQNFPPMEEPLPNVPGVPGYPMGQIPGQAPVNVESMGAGSSSSSSPQPSSSSSSSSWFGGFFGGEKKEDTSANDGSKTKVLESFDAPSPPSFEYK